MVFQPRLHRLGIAVRQEIDNVAPLQIHDDRAVVVPFEPSPVVDSHEPWRRLGLPFELFDPSKQRVGAGFYEHLNGEPSPGLAAQNMANCVVGLAEAASSTSMGIGKPQEPLGKDASPALGMRAKEATNRNGQPYGPSKAGQVSDSAVIPAVNAVGVRATEGTSG